MSLLGLGLNDVMAFSFSRVLAVVQVSNVQ